MSAFKNGDPSVASTNRKVSLPVQASFNAIASPESGVYKDANLPKADCGTENDVSVMPSGPRICASKKASNAMPETISTTRPMMSMPTEYSQRLPG